MDVKKLIRDLGGGTKVAAILNVTPQAVSNMAARGSFPTEYWPSLIRAAAKLGIEGVTPETLMKATAKRAARRRASGDSLKAAAS